MAEFQSKGAIGADLYTPSEDQEFTPGTMVTAEDKSTEELGEAKFMYVQANEAIDATEVVTIDQSDYGADLASANDIGPIGVAVADMASGEWGWVQCSGKAEAKVASGFAAGNRCYLTSTAGTIDDAVVAGDIIYGSISLSALNTPNTGTAYVGLNCSFVQDA